MGVGPLRSRHRTPTPRAVEALEPRALLSVFPAGPEFRASTTTTYTESTRHGMNAVAMDADGNFVVVWGGLAMGQRFNSTAVALGGPFALSSDASGFADTPSVAMNASGDFVATFHRENVAGVSGTTVWARRFSADGTPKGPDGRIGTSTSGQESSPSVAMEADGDYVVAWHEGPGRFEADRDVYARRFNADGTPKGDPFRVNTYTFSSQYGASVAVNDGGAFVITWTSWEQDGSMEGVYGQLYGADGRRVGNEFPVNQDYLSQQMESSVAIDAAGRFAVAWQSSHGGILLRRFGADGRPLHDERDVDGTAAIFGDNPCVVSDAAGGLLLTWDAYTSEADFFDTYVRRFAPDGSPLGDPLRVNTTLPGTQASPSVAMRNIEDFVVVWTDGEVGFPNNPNATPDGVYGRRYTPQRPPTTVVARNVFYNNSDFDARTPGAGPSDDGAIAPDKAALPAGTGRVPGLENVTTYEKGINGILIDVMNLPVTALLPGQDFEFSPAGKPPVSVTVRPGAGINGSDRVTLVWRDYNPLDTTPLPQAVANGWLTVTVNANARTGLSEPEVFSFGNLIGDTGDSATAFRVNALDLAAVKRAMNTAAPVTSATDFNRDGRTNALDLAIARRQLGRNLAPPPAPLDRRAGVGTYPSATAWLSSLPG